tara:strand:- start:151 stop:876 length:726 start_codon:yes stop_codon:yes gene_type:complete
MKKNKKITYVGDKIRSQASNWKFSKSVAKVFDSHVSKSVPLYHEAHSLILKMSDFFVQENITTIDIGSSTGTFLNLLEKRHRHKNVNYIGIEPQKEMIKISKNKNKNTKIKFINNKIENYKFPKSNLITSLYTMQFINPSKRQLVFNKIFKSLEWGGAFFLFEKVRGSDARFQDIATASYHEFKNDQGYSYSDIASKSISLKGVLEPFSTAGNQGLLKRAGFKDIMIVFKYICFEGYLAIK